MLAGNEVVIVDVVRTPIGRGHPEKGVYKDVHPAALLSGLLSGLIERTAIDPEIVEDVISGCVLQYGPQAANIGRTAWLEAGLPITTPATTVDRQCGSAQQSLNFAAALIGAGAHDVVLACGVEHMGRVPLSAADKIIDDLGSPYTPQILERYSLVHQGLSAELIADKWGITREECDAIAVRSHERAAKARSEARFEAEILPVETEAGPVTEDQGIRPGTSMEGLAELKPVFRPDGKLTAGSSSQVSDGASAALLMSRAKAEELGLTPRARIVDYLTVGVDPVLMLTGPIPATRAILERNEIGLEDVDLTEVNEAFSSVVAAWEKELEPDMDKVNVKGGAIALGHPLGSSGIRLTATLLTELERTGGKRGLVTMCCGGGLGTATLLETV